MAHLLILSIQITALSLATLFRLTFALRQFDVKQVHLERLLQQTCVDWERHAFAQGLFPPEDPYSKALPFPPQRP